MLETIQIVLLLVAGIVGTLLSIVLGWSESNDPFDVKKLVSSLIRGSIGAVIYIIGTYAAAINVSIFDYIVVFIFAAGFEALLKRGQGVATQKLS